MRYAIVGSGLAALAGYATLRHGGIAADEIAVSGTHDDPLEVWRSRAAAIRQQRMRSESDGHLAAAAWPGLALREHRPSALLRTVTNRYRPSVDLFLRHGALVVERTGWERSFRLARVERVAAVDGGFELDGEGPFAHVLLATGHPALFVPDEYRSDPRTVHAYEPHAYGAKVTVVGAGMAAATEWLNALEAGAEVVSIRRREPLRRPLNVPRPLFSKRGLARYNSLTPTEHASTLRALSQPSYPPGPEWDEPLRAAEREGRFRVEHSPNGAEQIICATGFRRGFAADPLLRRLVDEHGVPTNDRWLVLAPDSTVPALTDATRTLSVSGVAGQWAFPASDTIAGAKFAARAFLRRICRTR
jgi:cation diffusion facilitator CzcD-associated flavoprotein CzcO